MERGPGDSVDPAINHSLQPINQESGELPGILRSVIFD